MSETPSYFISVKGSYDSVVPVGFFDILGDKHKLWIMLYLITVKLEGTFAARYRDMVKVIPLSNNSNLLRKIDGLQRAGYIETWKVPAEHNTRYLKLTKKGETVSVGLLALASLISDEGSVSVVDAGYVTKKLEEVKADV